MTEPGRPHPHPVVMSCLLALGRVPPPTRSLEQEGDIGSPPPPPAAPDKLGSWSPRERLNPSPGSKTGPGYVLKQENQSELKMKGSGGVNQGWRLPDGCWVAGRPHGRCPHTCPRSSEVPRHSGKQVASGNHGSASLNGKSRAPAQG